MQSQAKQNDGRLLLEVQGDLGSCQTRRNIIIRSHDILDDGRLLLDVQGDLGSCQT